VLELAEKNAQLVRDAAKTKHAHMIMLQELKAEINSLENREFAESQMQAALMLRQLTNQPVSAQQQADEPQQSDTIRNLEERLQFANETINALL
jgi:hypothetical protein